MYIYIYIYIYITFLIRMFKCCLLLHSYTNSVCNDGNLLTLKIMLDHFQFRSLKQMFMHLTGKCIGTLTAKQIPLRLSLSVSGEFVGKHHTLRLRVMEEQFFVFLTLVSGVTRGVWGVQPPPPPRNSESPSKSCQTQSDCENC